MFKRQDVEAGRLEMKKLKISIKENGNTRFNLNEELNEIQAQLKKNVCVPSFFFFFFC